MTGARRYGPRMPKDEHAGGRDRPEFIATSSADDVRAFLRQHTIHSAAQVLSVSEASIKNYEREFGVRCKRSCRSCNQVFDYAQMVIEKNGTAQYCPACKEAIHFRKVTPDRVLMDLEVRDPFASWARMSLTRRRSDGINGFRFGQAMLGASI